MLTPNGEKLMSGSVLNWMQTNEGRHQTRRRNAASSQDKKLVKLQAQPGPVKKEKAPKQKGTLDAFLQPAQKSLIIDDTFSMEDFQLATMRWRQQNLTAQ